MSVNNVHYSEVAQGFGAMHEDQGHHTGEEMETKQQIVTLYNPFIILTREDSIYIKRIYTLDLLS